MTAARMRARGELRARFGSMLALAILLGLGSGAVLTVAAGARRTDSSYARFAREYKAADLLVFEAFDSSFADLDFDKVARLPQVVASGVKHLAGASDSALSVIADEGGLGKTINRIKVLSGHLPAPDSLDEAAVSFPFAKQRGLRVGDRLPLTFLTLDRGRFDVTLRIVGIEAAPGEFPPLLADASPGQGGTVRISMAAFNSLKQRNAFTLNMHIFRLRRGSADFPAVNDALSALAGGKPQLNQNLGAQAANVQRSIHLQSVALRIVGGLVALIGLLVLTQLIARQAALDATETPTLLALGMTRREVAMSGLWRYAMIGIAGGILATLSAFLASPLMPIGTARVAEPNGGFSFDALILGGGGLATVLVFLALAAWPLWNTTRKKQSRVLASIKPSLVARSASLSTFPPPVGTGIRLALESGSGKTEVPVRSSLFSVALAIVALGAALTFGASLDHLLNTPRLYGWNWDLHGSNNADQGSVDDGLKALDGVPEVAAAAAVDTPPIRLGDNVFDAIGMRQHKGVIKPVIVDGREPRSANEVALGVKTLQDAHASIGSTVKMSISAIEGGSARLKVVGTVVLPPNSDTARLGGGGFFDYGAEARMAPPGFTAFPPLSEMYIRLAPGVDVAKATAKIAAALGPDYSVLTPTRPSDLINFGQVQNLPVLLAGLVGVLAAATLAHTLITSIRRRRRDLAILKMLGFVPGQIRLAVAWQATAFVSVALLIGLPVGIAVGRVVWSVFAHQVGTLPEPVTPSIKLLLTIPAAVVLANLIAAIPGVVAGRMKPALALRAE